MEQKIFGGIEQNNAAFRSCAHVAQLPAADVLVHFITWLHSASPGCNQVMHSLYLPQDAINNQQSNSINQSHFSTH